MGKTKKVSISNDADVINARLQCRQVARDAGFGTIDQARISLAASELARVLLKHQHLFDTPAEILISHTQQHGQAGLQLIGLSTNSNAVTDSSSNNDLLSAIELVDEYLVENNEQGVRVTLMKWSS